MKIDHIFKGRTYFDIGVQQGKLYKKRGFTTLTTKFNKLHTKRQIEIYEKYYPEMLEEIRGIAVSLKEPRIRVLNYFLCNNFFFDETKDYILWIRQYKKKKEEKHKKWLIERCGTPKGCPRTHPHPPIRGCSIVGIQTEKNGKLKTIVARNYDTDPNLEPLVQTFRIEHSKVSKVQNSNVQNTSLLLPYSFNAVTDGGIEEYNKNHSIFDGDDLINNQGLYIGYTYSFSLHKSYGLTFYHYMRYLAEKCKTVKEVLELAPKIPLCVPKNFFIADKQGNMGVIEHNAGFQMRVIEPMRIRKSNVLIQTNHYVDMEFYKKYDKVFAIDKYHDTVIRFQIIKRFVKKHKNISMSKLQHLFRTQIKKGKSSIFQKSKINGTIWTLLMNLPKNKIKLMKNPRTKSLKV